MNTTVRHIGFVFQAGQSAGHRTLLYGHAVLLRHSHSNMVNVSFSFFNWSNIYSMYLIGGFNLQLKYLCAGTPVRNAQAVCECTSMGWMYKYGVNVQVWGKCTSMGWMYKYGVNVQVCG